LLFVISFYAQETSVKGGKQPSSFFFDPEDEDNMFL
jgi:hypothetical protein